MMLRCAATTALLVSCLVPSVCAQAVTQDVVYLKDGSVIHGEIIEQAPNVSVTIQTRDGNVIVCRMDDIAKIARRSVRREEVRAEKSPVTAFLLSLFVPGVGQYYNGEIGKGIVQQAFVLGGCVTAAAGIKEELHIYYDPWGDPYYSYHKREKTPWYWVGLCTAAGAYIWSVIDAPLSADRTNRERFEGQWGHLDEFGTPGLDAEPKEEGIGLGLVFDF
jgi:hypothetical protein